MTRTSQFRHVFTSRIPDDLDEATLYVSVDYATAMHLCACGCKSQVVTPLRPDRWRLTFDGESISLWPSIGNWGFPCRSHYWIERGSVRWAPAWADAQVEANRARRRPRPSAQAPAEPLDKTRSVLRRVWERLTGRH